MDWVWNSESQESRVVGPGRRMELPLAELGSCCGEQVT